MDSPELRASVRLTDTSVVILIVVLCAVAPEVIRKQECKPNCVGFVLIAFLDNAKCDVFSFGMVLFELVTSSYPGDWYPSRAPEDSTEFDIACADGWSPWPCSPHSLVVAQACGPTSPKIVLRLCG